ncbi:hypothetical protein [Hoeflea halophila]|nr:hypothetical protein [Hoeflea halophila]
MADGAENTQFAERLQARLEASVGRATADVGQTSELRIQVLERKEDPSPVRLFGGTSQSVTLDMALVDSNTEEVQRSQVLSLNFTDFNRSHAETVLVARLTDDIRTRLGLSGYTPYPVRSAKRDVVRPNPKPDDFDANDPSLRAVDPLLNGTVTPTTVVLEAEPEASRKFDYTKPLLGGGATAQQAAPAAGASPAAPEVVQQMKLRPAEDPDVADTYAGAETDASDDLCVITLENDCS